MKRKPRQKKKAKYTPKQITALKAHALKLYQADESHAVELGHALLEVRDALKNQHGAFKKWWQRHKLSQSRVSYCMRLASKKHARYKAKQQSAEHQRVVEAAKFVNGEVNKLFRLFTNPTDELQTRNSLIIIRNQLRDAVAATCGKTAELAGFCTF